ncbi:MAG: heparinase II/III family protein [Aristaeellaceae bacterium]
MENRLETRLMQARQALAQYGAAATPCNRAMLEDMIAQSETVLRGEPLVHLSGSRAFLRMTQDDWEQYMLSHPVMYGFDQQPGQAETYGLEKALAWFVRSCTAPEEADTPRSIPEMAFEQEAEDLLLFSPTEWQDIRAHLPRDTELQNVYAKIRRIADRTTEEGVQRIWDATWAGNAQLPSDEDLFSDTAKGLNFSVPEGAVSLQIRFDFPEQRSWRVRKLRISSADTGDQSGEAELTMDSGASSLTSGVSFAVRGGSMCTLHFMVDQREKLREDIRVLLSFADRQGAQVGQHVFSYNRKAWYPAIFFNLDMQCNAICYAVTGEEAYARKAIRLMLLFLDDFAQGALYWLMHNRRPEDRDNYGAVQAGRNLAATAMTYALVRQRMDEAENRHFCELCGFLIHDVLDLRDRTCLTDERAQRGTGNWQTDMCIGAAMLAAAVPGIPHRKMWMMNAEKILSAQLSINLNHDGSWPESLRYHHAALEHLCTFARFWEHETGENWFTSHHLDRMFAYTIGTQLPPCPYFDGHISTPPFGDHKLGNGSEYHLLGSWAARVALSNPQLGAQMLETWQRAGCPSREPGGESVVAELLLRAPECGEAPCDTAYRTQSRHFPDAGLTLMRNEAACLAVMCSPRRIGHGHLDQGSFIYYWHDLPLVMDSGIEGYFDATTQWHISSLSHACMLFASYRAPTEDSTAINLSAGNYARRRGWCDTPTSSELLALSLGGPAQQIRMRIADPDGRGFHLRQLTLEADGTVVIEDRVTGYTGEVLFCLPMLVQAATITRTGCAASVRGKGYDGADLLVNILSPVLDIWTEEGRVTPMHPGEEPQCIPFLRVRANASDGFTVHLCGVHQGKEQAECLQN